MEWLGRYELTALHDVLVENDLDIDILSDLTDDDLKEIGLSLGQRRRLLKAIKTDQPIPADAAPGPADSPAATAQAATVPLPAAGSSSAANVGHAERRLVTVMFVDLVGSTEMSTKLDPEEMAAILAAYQNTVSEVIATSGGYIAKFMGDGVLVYFGWPGVREEEPVHAMRAGLHIIKAVSAMKGPAGDALTVRIGCDSGWVVIGELIGNQTAQERTIVGDTPNMAARLQGEAEPGMMVIGAATHRLVSHAFQCEAMPPRMLRGFAEPVELAQVVAERQVASSFENRHEGQRTLPLVGRDAEVSLLLDRWALAKEAQGQGLILVGEAGIGKSRILSEVLKKIGHDDHERIILQCSPNFSEIPLWPVVQLFNRLTNVQGNEGETALGALGTYLDAVTPDPAAYLPALATLLSIRSPITKELDSLTPARRRAVVQDRLLKLIIDNASQKPLLIVLEDAHWADPSTLELFSLLLSAIAETRVLIIVTTRPENEPTFAGDNQLRLSLSKMRPSAVIELIQNISLSQKVPPELIKVISERTDGIPLFIEELTKSVLETSLEATLRASPIPASLHDILMARLDRLPEVRETAQIAACIGREFGEDLLRAAAQLPADVIDAGLEKLIQAELIYRRGHGDNGQFIFKHALVRDAAWASLTSKRKISIHNAILEALQADPNMEQALIGYHAAEARKMDVAFDAYLAAGKEASKISANSEAIDLLTRARALASEKQSGDIAEAQLRAEVALSIPLIAAYGYASTEVETLLTDALAHDPAIVGPENLFKLKRVLWNCRQDQSRLDESLAVAMELQAQAELAGRGDWLRLAYRACGSNLLYQGELRDAEAYFRRGLTVTLPWVPEETLLEHGEEPEIISRTYLAWIAAIDGRIDEAQSEIEDAIAASRELALPIVTAFLGCIQVWVLYQERDYENAIHICDDYIELCKENGFPFWLSAFEMVRGWAGVMAGEGRSAVERAVKGLTAWKATGASLHLCTWNGVLGNAALAFGDLELAETAALEGLGASQRFGDRFLLTDVLLVKAQVEHKRGNTSAAIATLEDCLQLATQQGVRMMQSKAMRLIAAFSTDPEKQERMLAKSEEIDQQLSREAQHFRPGQAEKPSAQTRA